MEKNDKVDLHIHTTYSNGKDSLISVLEHAERNGVKVISITDYNSLKSYIELKNNIDISKYFSGEIIVGLEVRCKFKGENGQERNSDMLAYNIDIDNIEDMQNWLEQNTDRDKSILEQVKQLKHFKDAARKLGLKFDEDLELDPDNNKAGMAMINNILKYYRENVKVWPELERYKVEPTSVWQEVFTNPKTEFYWDMAQYCPRLEDFIEQVHKNKGKVFVAHPYAYVSDSNKTEKQATEDLIKYVKNCLELGVDGVECFNQYNCNLVPNAIVATKALKQYCIENEIKICGGTDYHQKDLRHRGIGNLGSETVQNAEAHIPWDIIKNWALPIKIICKKTEKIH